MDEKDAQLIRIANPEKKTLLERYGVPVEHLSYEYISKCTNGKTLERIVTILRSGEEGYYPDLTRHAEERLAVVKPTSIILRKSEPVLTRNMLDPSECKELDTDINHWTSEMQSREKDLEEGKNLLTSEPVPQPNVRQLKEEFAKRSTVTRSKDSNKTKRIASYDYAAWDKYDVDTELSKIDIREEQKQVETKRFQQKQKESLEKRKLNKETIINKSSLTGTELNVMAEQEKGKGNEAFKVGDYEEALEHYNTSIKIDPTLTTYNNRAITFIKLGRYENALKDCNFVLDADCANIKALLRRAVTLEHLQKSSEALADYEAVLKLEPINPNAIAGVKKLRKPCESRKVRMAIIEQSEAEREEPQINKTETNNNYKQPEPKLNIGNSICFCDRAPGPSQNLGPRPHFKADYCLENDNREKIIARNDASKIFGSPENSFNSTKENTSSYLFRNPKSIFTCPMPSRQNGAVIIEELPNESINNNSPENKNISNGTASKKNNIDRKLPNNNKAAEAEKSNVKKSTKNCEVNVTSARKHEAADKCERKASKPEKYDPKNFNNIETSYEFMRVWRSLKNDDLEVYAQLLRSLNADKLDLVLGNELDGNMLSKILHCLEQHFCKPSDKELLNNYLNSFSRMKRFSIVNMFMNAGDKRAVRNILNFLEKHGTSGVSSLRQIYCV
ncbi:spag1 axonemal dynein assembly factor [Lasioglossum baleicum]|uniref:spag1 axonemal dynein assembly factor n=1 Tax=Lasioglossum baleicum TaxID=434251 RepID=UPI003FCC51A1